MKDYDTQQLMLFLPICRAALHLFPCQHTVPVRSFRIERAELHGKGAHAHVLIPELRELIEQQLLRCGVVMLFEVLLLEDLARAIKGLEQIEGDGAVG